MWLSFKPMGLSWASVTSLNNFGERNLSMFPSAEMLIGLSLAFVAPPYWHLRSLCAHLNLSHPIHAFSDCRSSHSQQKDPLHTYVCCLIYTTHSHLRKIFGCFLRLVVYLGYSGKLFKHICLDILSRWVYCALLCQGEMGSSSEMCMLWMLQVESRRKHPLLTFLEVNWESLVTLILPPHEVSEMSLSLRDFTFFLDSSPFSLLPHLWLVQAGTEWGWWLGSLQLLFF